MTERRWHSSVDECQRRKFSAKKPEDMLKLGPGASKGLPKYFLKLLAKTYRDLREDQYDNNKDREKRDNLCHH